MLMVTLVMIITTIMGSYSLMNIISHCPHLNINYLSTYDNQISTVPAVIISPYAYFSIGFKY